MLQYAIFFWARFAPFASSILGAGLCFFSNWDSSCSAQTLAKQSALCLGHTSRASNQVHNIIGGVDVLLGTAVCCSSRLVSER
jgi:hypothetical protein